MLVVVKEPHIEIRGEQIPPAFLDLVKGYFSGLTEIRTEAPEDGLEDWFGSDLQRQIEASTTVGALLKAYRNRDGLSGVEAAGKIGISPQEVSDIEAGRRPVGPKNARRLATVFKTKLDVWLPEKIASRS